MYRVIYSNTDKNYLIHFNKNHDKKNGQFTTGDGDGDGINDDHAHRKKNSFKKNIVKAVESTPILGDKLRQKDAYKKHVDTTIKKGTDLQTLSYNPDRTKDTDMFYASYNKLDNLSYHAILRKNKMAITEYDEDGNEIGQSMAVKKKITNTATSDIKVASEDSSVKQFVKLYRNDKDFKKFVDDENRLMTYANKSNEMSSFDRFQLKNYKEAVDTYDKIKNNPKYEPTDDDLSKIYRLFDYSIVYDGSSTNDTKGAKDMSKQRAKFFRELKNEGYGACLDTNDALNNNVKATAPVIIFDMEKVVLKDVEDTKASDPAIGVAAGAAKKILGV